MVVGIPLLVFGATLSMISPVLLSLAVVGLICTAVGGINFMIWLSKRQKREAEDIIKKGVEKALKEREEKR